jgi:hypothetical protein
MDFVCVLLLTAVLMSNLTPHVPCHAHSLLLAYALCYWLTGAGLGGAVDERSLALLFVVVMYPTLVLAAVSVHHWYRFRPINPTPEQVHTLLPQSKCT